MDFRRKNNFWYCIKPLALYFGVVLCVETVFIFFILYSQNLDYASLTYETVQSAVMDKILYYTAHISSASAVVLTVICGLIFKKNEKKLFDDRYDSKLNAKDFFELIVLSIGVYIMTSVVLTVIFGTDSGYSYDQLVEQTFFSGGYFITVLSVVILQPIALELVFRGLLFNRFRTRLPAMTALIISAVNFTAIGIGSAVQFLYLAILGLILAYVYIKYENIIACIFVHSMFYALDLVSIIKVIYDFVNSKPGLYIFYSLGFFCFTYAFTRLKRKQAPALKASENTELKAE